MPSVFKRVSRPDPIVPDTTLDQELGNAADDANLTLYFVNLAVASASDLVNADFGGKSDPFCKVTLGEVSQRTVTVQNSLDPVWNDQMNFFVADKPDKITFHVFDEDTGMGSGKDDSLGEVEFEFSDMFETGVKYEGELKLRNVKKGRIRVALRCRMMKPIETEIKLGYVEKQLEGKGKEQEATVAALDESEKLREDAIEELSTKEQEIIQKADELAEKQKLHQTELTEKEQRILDQAQAIEQKIQDYEEAQVALKETELKKQEAETKLTEAEEEILRKAEELETKERENADALTAKEKEILAAADKLEEKERAHDEVVKKMEQTEALRAEVENELTAKEQVIQEQAKQIELKAKESADTLSAKEKEILEASKALAEREAAAKDAQQKQDAAQNELDAMIKEKELLEGEVVKVKGERDELSRKLAQATGDANAASDLARKHEQKQAEVNSLTKDKEGLEKDLGKANADLRALQEKEAAAKAGTRKAGCMIM
uniref:C2 domain-containing protein n=1 Tax=Odontella aurita TaxID=265563 RepID=A0A7S4NGG9_9STRA|mmetsp:Transcript_6375/g.18660  ORF Transcript_6375/g.18660 Transcript_6375/m.18660 type:complete len:491 (+) Transcript_6375:357-1829(+)